MKIKSKVFLSIMFIISLILMSLSWFGSARGVQEIKGTIVLYNPLTIISIIMFFISIWISFKNKNINKRLPLLTSILIVLVEIYTFFIWHYQTITGKISLNSSLERAYPEFYFGIIISIIMCYICYLILKKDSEISKI